MARSSELSWSVTPVFAYVPLVCTYFAFPSSDLKKNEGKGSDSRVYLDLQLEMVVRPFDNLEVARGLFLGWASH